jgi:hypothetical protein
LPCSPLSKRAQRASLVTPPCLAVPRRFELRTSRSGNECSAPNELRDNLVRAGGFEPPVSCIRGTRFSRTKLCPEDWRPVAVTIRSHRMDSAAATPAASRALDEFGVPGPTRTATRCDLSALPLPLGYRHELVDHRRFELRPQGLRVPRSAVEASGL